MLHFLPLLLLFSSLTAGNVDSLRQVLGNRTGADRLPVLLKLCELEVRTRLSAEEALTIAEELVQRAATARDTSAWVEGCVCAISKQDRSADKTAIEDWFRQAEQLAAKRPDLLVKILFWKGSFLLDNGQPGLAIEEMQRGIRLCQTYNLPTLDHIKLLGALAKHYSRQNESRTADSLGRQAVTLARSPADSAEALRYWAGIQEDLGRPDEAITAYLQAYRLEKAMGSIIPAAYNLRQAGSILRNQGSYEQAAKYYEESIALSEQIGYTLGMASAWHSLGGLYKLSGQYEKALHYYQLALSMKKDLGRPKKVLTTIRDMAELYHLTQNYDSCLAVSVRHLPMAKTMELAEAESQLSFLAAIASAKLHQTGAANQYLQQGRLAVAKVTTKDEMPLIYKFAAESHALLGYFENAFQYQLQYQSVQDSIYNTEKSRIVSEMETRFETEKKEQQIVDLAEENELNNARIAAARARQQGLLIGLLSFGALAFALYRNAVARKRNNAVLERTNTELTRKNHEVQTLLREIHHRVKNNLQIISSLLRLQARKISDEATLEALRTGQARVRSMALLHQRLYQGDELKNIPMKAYLTDLTQSLLDAYKVDETHIHLNTDLADLALDVDVAVPIGLIVNELMTNS
jgi:two-component system, sensor histidine kinase PdtaS